MMIHRYNLDVFVPLVGVGLRSFRSAVCSVETQDASAKKGCVLEHNTPATLRAQAIAVQRRFMPTRPNEGVTQGRDKFEHLLLDRLANLMAEEGPARDVMYNPHYGYEPYWADGKWVFNRQSKADACTENDCPTIYKEFGPMCIVSSQILRPLEQYRDLDNWCDLRFIQCMEPNIHWKIAYRGKCKPDYVMFNNSHKQVKKRADRFIKQYLDKKLTTWEYMEMVTYTMPVTDGNGKPIFARTTIAIPERYPTGRQRL